MHRRKSSSRFQNPAEELRKSTSTVCCFRIIFFVHASSCLSLRNVTLQRSNWRAGHLQKRAVRVWFCENCFCFVNWGCQIVQSNRATTKKRPAPNPKSRCDRKHLQATYSFNSFSHLPIFFLNHTMFFIIETICLVHKIVLFWSSSDVKKKMVWESI